jgi:F-type H+-transporting ATPase subunit epsilon
MKEFEYEIVTPEKRTVSGKAVSMTFAGVEGSFQTLYNHAPMISALDVGVIKVETSEGSKDVYAEGGGVVEVLNNKVLALVSTLELGEEIDSERAKRAAERAKAKLKDIKRDEAEYDQAEHALKRALNRLRASEFSKY